MRLRERSRLMARRGADKTAPWAAALLLGGVLSLLLSTGEPGSSGQSPGPADVHAASGAVRTDCMEGSGARSPADAGQERSAYHGTADGDRP